MILQDPQTSLNPVFTVGNQLIKAIRIHHRDGRRSLARRAIDSLRQVRVAAPEGSPRVTYDVDLCYRRSPDNLERLATALGTLNLTLRGAPSNLKFRLDAQALALGQHYTFEVDGEYPLDFLGYLEPLGTYDDPPHAGHRAG